MNERILHQFTGTDRILETCPVCLGEGKSYNYRTGRTEECPCKGDLVDPKKDMEEFLEKQGWEIDRWLDDCFGDAERELKRENTEHLPYI